MILETVGEVAGQKRGFESVRLRVHRIASADGLRPDIGLELVSRGFLSYQMSPIKLQHAEVEQLIQLLQQGKASHGS